MKELLNIIEKEATAWDFYVPSLDDILFIQELEHDLNFLVEL
jgi:hypothetical protein